MTKENAIAVATEVVRAHSISANIDFEKITAFFVNGEESVREIRIDFPNTDPNFTMNDCWLVDFRLLKVDEMLRESVGVRVADKTGRANFIWIEDVETE